MREAQALRSDGQALRGEDLLMQSRTEELVAVGVTELGRVNAAFTTDLTVLMQHLQTKFEDIEATKAMLMQ